MIVMSELDKAVLKHMEYLVLVEHRSFSYIDFKSFQLDGKTFTVSHGTFRNKISKLVKQKIVELSYKSHVSFYTLHGHHFGNKSMTDNHMGNTSVISVIDLVKFIEKLPLDKKSIHDIHLKFLVPDIWKIISQNKKYTINPISNDIKLEPLISDNLKIRATIHHTDTVSVVVGCSQDPIVVEEVQGIIRISNSLTRIEERISRVVDECGERLEGGYERIPIPSNERWIVTMWHFGRDSMQEYAGIGFSLTWGYGREALLRIYTKKMKSGKSKVRIESQENPNNELTKAVKLRLGD
jgi:hypothetical protein